MTLPSHARIVVVGGGIAGCSTAYHLAALGEKDVLVLEQGKLTCGTTWHAAGLVGQMRPNRTMTRMSKYGIELYSTLEAETGLATGWKQCGSVNVAQHARADDGACASSSRWRAASASSARRSAPAKAGELFPVLRTDDLAGAIWIPGDGKANPADLTMSLAKGARMRGVKIAEDTEVVAVRSAAGPTGPRVTGLRVRHGGDEVEIACEVVVNCAGQWARQFGALAGVNVPLWSAEHFYIVTDRIDGVHPMLPVLRDPDGYIYYKEEVGGLLMGGFEPKAKPWTVDPIPATFQFELLDEDWDQFEPLMTAAIHRTPCLETAKVKMLLNGPESFTPDGNFILGEAPELRHFFVAAGFNSAGIANSGGAGKLIAEWIVAGAPQSDLCRRRHPPLRRAHRQQEGARRAHRRDARPALRDALAAPGARDRAAAANEPALRPARRQGRDLRRQERLGAGELLPRRRRGGDAAVPAHARQARLARRHGRASSARPGRRSRSTTRPRSARCCCRAATRSPSLQRLCANEMDVAPGRMVYTPMLNERGGFESDVTVTRLAADRFLIVTGSAQTPRDLDWISRHTRAGESAALVDVSAMTAVLSLMGPNARTLLGRVGAADTFAALAPEQLRFATTREIDLGFARVRAARMSYVGGPGFELYVPIEMARHVWLALHEASEGLGATAAASPMPATTRSMPCASRPAGAPGAPSSARTRRRSRPERCSRSSSASATTSSARRRCVAHAGRAAAQEARHRRPRLERRLRLGRRGARRRRRRRSARSRRPAGATRPVAASPSATFAARPRRASTPAARSRSTVGRGGRGIDVGLLEPRPSARRQRSR